MTSDLIGNPIEEFIDLFDRMRYPQRDDPMGYGGIVDIDPEGQFLPAIFQGFEIEGLQSFCEVFMLFKLLRVADRIITDDPSFRIDKSAFSLAIVRVSAISIEQSNGVFDDDPVLRGMGENITFSSQYNPFL